MRNFLTNRHIRYWKNRKIDWKQAYFTPDHSHRELIIKALKNIKFGSVLEIGCGAGANLYKISQTFPNVEIGGIDLSNDAIETCKEKMPDAAVFEVSNAHQMFLSDKSSDVILTDACLIYIDPFNINKVIKEISRVSRNNIVLVEFHSNNWLKRLGLRLISGYNAYDYKRLLEKHGFYDVQLRKLSEKDWPGEPWKSFGYIITATND